MSTAESWDLEVPEDDAQLGAEVRRHIAGLKPGQWVRITVDSASMTITVTATLSESVASEQSDDGDLPFIGSVTGGPSDLASRTDKYLSQGFGR